METKPISLVRAIAEYYLRDACDFAERFDILWERQTHKTGRIKSFVDLLMAAECALKCHIFLGREREDPKEVYCHIRKAGHNIGALADYASYLTHRNNYDAIKAQLNDFSVFLRYALDAYDAFFPLLERENAKLKHSETVGNNSWVLKVRDVVELLIEDVQGEFLGFVSTDLGAIFENERQMREFMKSFAK